MAARFVKPPHGSCLGLQTMGNQSPTVALLLRLLLLVSPDFAGPLEAGLSQAPPLPRQRLALDPASAAQRFDGHGALSAGASSRLLFDYAEPQRSQLLDFLFAPGVGAPASQTAARP